MTDDSHWWDGSQIYGSDRQSIEARRGPDGTMRVDEHQLIPEELEKQLDLSGVAGNAWLGLAALHILFTREHNAIVAMLHKRHPELSEDQTFDTARLINAALMAKIHTVEWTPAVISHPTTQRAMKINWWGLVGERATRRFGRLTANEFISGIPGSPTEHHGVPYSLTEEFAAVYRMHPLLPDDYTFRSATDNSFLDRLRLTDLDVVAHPATAASSSAWRTRCTPWAGRRPAWSACTTTPSRCSASPGPTVRSSTSPPSTCSAIGNAASPATTNSAGCCT